MSEDVTPLKSCPFCGGATVLRALSDQNGTVRCRGCGCTVASPAAWNRRPPAPGWEEAKEACAKGLEAVADQWSLDDDEDYASAYRQAAATVRALPVPGIASIREKERAS